MLTIVPQLHQCRICFCDYPPDRVIYEPKDGFPDIGPVCFGCFASLVGLAWSKRWSPVVRIVRELREETQ